LLPLQLLAHGANVNAVSSKPSGGTALHEAIARNKPELAEMLLRVGCG